MSKPRRASRDIRRPVSAGAGLDAAVSRAGAIRGAVSGAAAWEFMMLDCDLPDNDLNDCIVHPKCRWIPDFGRVFGTRVIVNKFPALKRRAISKVPPGLERSNVPPR